MARRVAMLCWEAGGGLGHVVGLVRIAEALRDRGWTTILAFPSKRQARHFVPHGMQVMRAPKWGEGVETPHTRSGSSATMVDMLADIGLASEPWIREQIVGWHLRFAAAFPDLVIADYAPGAVLAARGRVPCIGVGTGFGVPPAGLDRFPRLHTQSEPKEDEAALLAGVNSVLERFGSPPFERLADTLRGDRAMACTLPVLDPYSEWREEELFCPLLSEPVRERGAEAQEIFCYFGLATGAKRLRKLIAALTGLPAPVVLYAPGLALRDLKKLEAGGVRVLARPAIAGLQLRRTRLAIHAGGHGLAAAAILAGTPQIILDYDVEKELTGRALEKAGLARRHRFDATSAAAIRESILAAYADPALDAAAREAAARHAGCRESDPALIVAERAEALLVGP
jgi:UDP:flavonoid glycosyltransferase YjiC (YdhE family)